MISHAVELCPDDPIALRDRLDALTRDGTRILSVMWQAQRTNPDQSAAYDASGSFVIVTQTEVREPVLDDSVARPEEVVVGG